MISPVRGHKHNDCLGVRHKLSLWLGVIGIVLLPFSTSPDQFIVVSFGLPFIIFSLFIGSDLIIKTLFEVQGSLLYLLLIALLFSIVPIFTSFLSPTLGPSLYRAVVFFIGYLLAIWSLGMSRSNKGLRLIYHAFMLNGLVLSSYYIVNFLVRSGEFGVANVLLDRVAGGYASLPWGASNVVAAVILVTLICCFALGNFTDSRLFWLLLVVGTLAIALTLSRTVAILLLFSFFLFGYRNFRREGLVTSSLILLLTICIVIASMYMFIIYESDTFNYLTTSRIDFDNITSGGGRLDIWADSFRNIPETLFIPNGYYSSLYLYGLTSHNYFLTTALEQGFFGLAISGTFFLGLLSYFRKNRKIRESYFLMWFVVIVNISVEDLVFTQTYIFTFWLLFAISIAHRRYLYNN